MGGGRASHLLSGGSGVGISTSSAVFHAVFEAFDSATQITAQVFQLLGTEDQDNNQ